MNRQRKSENLSIAVHGALVCWERTLTMRIQVFPHETPQGLVRPRTGPPHHFVEDTGDYQLQDAGSMSFLMRT
jgi:hypothetical protein